MLECRPDLWQQILVEELRYFGAPRVQYAVEAELMKNPANHPIAQFRDAQRKVGDGEAERQQAGIIDLQPVVEDSDADGCAGL